MSDIKNGPAEKEAPDSKKQIREKRKAISKWPVVLAVFCAAAAIFMLSYRYYAQEKARRLTEAECSQSLRTCRDAVKRNN